jgi:3-oxoacyl-[acyl-carrier protein] reductase
MMIPDLKDKVVLVTGGSTGIGAAVARAFGAAGSSVIVHFHASEAAAHEVVSGIEGSGGHAHALRADATKPEQLVGLVKSTIDRYGRLDVLINNVGDLVRRCPIADSTEELFDAVIDLNVRSVVTTSRAAIPQFRAQGGGAIINTTSIAARNGGGPGSVLYASAKAFVSTLTRGLAKELAADRVRVNAVAPGVIITPLQARHTSEAQLEAFRAAVPLGRLGTADECVGAFLYLASSAMSGYVTGQILEVNGGQLMP